MRVCLSILLLFFIAAEVKAQTASASLYIKLSDVQSVQFVDLPDQAKVVLTEKKTGNRTVSILNPRTAQVRKFESQNENSGVEFQQLNETKPAEIPDGIFAGSKSGVQLASINLKTKGTIPLVIYQVDPR